MSQDDLSAELFVRGLGVCPGTTFSGAILGSSHAFLLSGSRVRVSLPSAEFSMDSHDPIGPSTGHVHFQSGYVGQSFEKSFYGIDQVYVEVDIPELVRIPKSLLEVDAAQLSPEVMNSHPHLEALSVQYDELAASAWMHWMRVARWAINEPLIGVPNWSSNERPQLKMPRLREKTTGFSIWASTGIITMRRSADIDLPRWAHIGKALADQLAPPVWFDYLVEAEQRLCNHDFSGCVLSSAIACETVARACYFHLLGAPRHPTAADMVDRTAVQAIIGRWKELTGIKAGGKVHKIFEARNRLVHSGSADVIDEAIARETLSAASNFVDGGDKWWFNQKGENNPRAEAAEWMPARQAAKPTT